MGELTPTAAEKAAISELRAIARRWPKTLWLFSASGTLCVMRRDPGGDPHHLQNGSVDPAYVLATIAIPNDGGDW